MYSLSISTFFVILERVSPSHNNGGEMSQPSDDPDHPEDIEEGEDEDDDDDD